MWKCRNSVNDRTVTNVTDPLILLVSWVENGHQKSARETCMKCADATQMFIFIWRDSRVALSWVLGRLTVSSVIIAARKPEQLEDNIDVGPDEASH
jgi:hypothetical protein